MKQIYIVLATKLFLSFYFSHANGQETSGIVCKADFIAAYFLPNDDVIII